MCSPEELLPLVARAGRLGLGPGARFVRCLGQDGLSGEAQFASAVAFVTAEFQADGQPAATRRLLVKHNMPDPAVRSWLKLDHQFCNEVFVYEAVLPFLRAVEGGGDTVTRTFPGYLYGSATLSGDPDKYVIVLEDLRDSGFIMCPQILDLDFEHCALAFKKLGAFHALSFAAKKSKPQEFFEVIKSFVETRLFEDNREDGDYLFAASVGRAAEPLVAKGKFVEEIQRLTSKLKHSIEYMADLLSVQEPMGVICHGDFCRNNVLYKYENGTPTDVKFFDLATARYGSPMLDFTFFFLLNCSESSRRQHKEEFLRIYHESLASAIPGLEVPSLEDFREEFRCKAMYGFLHCSFFKPAMMDPAPFNPVEEVVKSCEDRARMVLSTGGEAGTQVTATLLQELIQANCEL